MSLLPQFGVWRNKHFYLFEDKNFQTRCPLSGEGHATYYCWNICMLPDGICHRKCYLTSLMGAAWQWDSQFARDWSSKSSSVNSSNQHRHPQVSFASSHASQINYSNFWGLWKCTRKLTCLSRLLSGSALINNVDKLSSGFPQSFVYGAVRNFESRSFMSFLHPFCLLLTHSPQHTVPSKVS